MGRSRLLQQVPELADGVVRLRALSDADVGWLHAACSDPDIVRWTPIRADTRPEQVAAWIARQPERMASQTSFDWGLVRADDGAPVGQAGLHRIDTTIGEGEVTYWVEAHARGAGLATRAVRCIAHFAFTTLHLERLELLTMIDNTASQRVAQKANFVSEGVRRSALPIKGRREHLVVYSLLATDDATEVGAR